MIQSDFERYYDDRRRHLVALGADDNSIAHWAQEAVDRGIPVDHYLLQMERHLTLGESSHLIRHRLYPHTPTT